MNEILLSGARETEGGGGGEGGGDVVRRGDATSYMVTQHTAESQAVARATCTDDQHD